MGLLDVVVIFKRLVVVARGPFANGDAVALVVVLATAAGHLTDYSRQAIIWTANENFGSVSWEGHSRLGPELFKVLRCSFWTAQKQITGKHK